MSEFEVGQRVRVTNAGDNNHPAEDGDIGTVVEVMLDSDLVLLDIDGKSERVWLFSDRLEKVEVTEGTNDDSPEDEGPTLRLTAEGLVIRGPLSFFDVNKTVDVVNHPPPFRISHGAGGADSTQQRALNGGTAVKHLGAPRVRRRQQDGGRGEPPAALQVLQRC